MANETALRDAVFASIVAHHRLGGPWAQYRQEMPFAANCGCGETFFAKSEDDARSAWVAHLAHHLAAHPQASPPPVQGGVTQYSEQALADGCIEFLEERSVEWMADGGVQRMFNAIASVFEKYAPQEIMDRFREKLGAIGQQCYVEGSLRVWEEISAQQRALGAPLPQNPDRIAHSQTDTQEGEVEAHEIDDIIEVAISEGMEDDDWTAFSIARRVHEGLAHNGLAVTAIASPQHGDAAQQQEQQP